MFSIKGYRVLNLDSRGIELKNSKKEVDRLVKNWRALLDIMPEMVFLIREDYGVEYMNASAIAFFGDIRGQQCYKGLHHADHPCKGNCPVKMTLQGEVDKGTFEMQVKDSFVEYSFVPFDGYLGDRLILVDMRDITQRKLHEAEIATFNTNIEEILQRKIGELNESQQVREQLSRRVDVLKTQLKLLNNADEMIGSSRALRKLREMIAQVADSDATILITGESGTGKELAANLIRNCSRRSDKPFLKVNCSAINDNLLESDLFGYEKGSFTGAASRKKGKFEIVDGGTIFLDEIGEISPKMQTSLLRILQNGEVIRVGGNEAIKVDVRIITATNLDLVKAVREGRFRLDLFYRLNIINIVIPPLRERKEDIIELTAHFVKQYRQAFKKDIDFLPKDIIDLLLHHPWPGNVRELENVIQRAVLMSKNNIISEKDLIFDSTTSFSPTSGVLSQFEERITEEPLKNILGEIERCIIVHLLEKKEGNVQAAAKTLGVGKTAFYEKLKRYNIPAKAVKK
ncbi:MAG: hypothetical protein A2511_09630 [Deltaproteobacteria bacterium RIFOXYD12_FULL_50_9]|nr:MAG: hypothetical protein A2511_09630 [Deltaproteobacteria bacterium RIFOXYD12_FULL_50_9]